MTIQNDTIYQNHRHLSQAIASIDLMLQLGHLPYFGWVILTHTKKHLLRDYARSK